METIAASCRALACDARLLILYHLALEDELQTSELARRVRTSQDATSHHLRPMAALGFLFQRRSGARVFYRLNGSNEIRAGFVLGGVVRRALLEPRWATGGWSADRVLHVAPETAAKVTRSVLRALDVIFDAATAFTHIRRLQLFRWMGQQGLGTIPAMSTALSMSPLACCRHLDKLRRRGYVAEESPCAWGPATQPKTPFHGELGAAVTERLGRG